MVGLFLLIFHAWLSDLYSLPFQFLIFQGFCNLGYSFCSYTLAASSQRAYRWVVRLAAANMVWGVLCFVWLFWYSNAASYFGSAHLLLEAVFVGGLGYLEWRYRHSLATVG